MFFYLFIKTYYYMFVRKHTRLNLRTIDFIFCFYFCLSYNRQDLVLLQGHLNVTMVNVFIKFKFVTDKCIVMMVVMRMNSCVRYKFFISQNIYASKNLFSEKLRAIITSVPSICLKKKSSILKKLK